MKGQKDLIPYSIIVQAKRGNASAIGFVIGRFSNLIKKEIELCLQRDNEEIFLKMTDSLYQVGIVGLLSGIDGYRFWGTVEELGEQQYRNINERRFVTYCAKSIRNEISHEIKSVKKFAKAEMPVDCIFTFKKANGQ